MINIMIVDDMPIFREFLQGFINWSAYGFRISAVAVDGKDALEKIEIEAPDIVLTDITMPFINGIELAKIIYEKYPEISTILITGHDDFSYAKQALQVGVCDYILKPFEKEELILSLLKIKDNIGVVNESGKVLPSKTYENFLKNTIAETTPSIEEVAELKVSLPYSYYKYYFIDLNNQQNNIELLYDWQDILIRLIKDKINHEIKFKILKDIKNNLLVLMNFETQDQAQDYEIAEFAEFVKTVKNQLNIRLTFELSEVYDKFSKLKEDYASASQNFNNEKNSADLYVATAVNQVYRALESYQFDLCFEKINYYFGELKAIGQESAVMNFLTGLISILVVNISNNGRISADIFGKELDLYSSLSKTEGIEEKKSLVLDYYKQRIAFEKTNKDKKDSEIIEKVCDYIKYNLFNENLCIPSIAKSVLLNQTYLRKMFKSCMGLTISDYITKEKMEQAKRKILTENKTLNKISEEMGFNDVAYFSKCFKKYFGFPPKDLKQKNN